LIYVFPAKFLERTLIAYCDSTEYLFSQHFGIEAALPRPTEQFVKKAHRVPSIVVTGGPFGVEMKGVLATVSSSVPMVYFKKRPHFVSPPKNKNQLFVHGSLKRQRFIENMMLSPILLDGLRSLSNMRQIVCCESGHHGAHRTKVFIVSNSL
jgi:hypothetical protein